MTDVILQDLKDGLLTITMNRPERKNAMSPDFTLGLLQAAQRAADDPEVRAVLLKGAGGTFCVGGDVRGMADPEPQGAELRGAPHCICESLDSVRTASRTGFANGTISILFRAASSQCGAERCRSSWTLRSGPKTSRRSNSSRPGKASAVRISRRPTCRRTGCRWCRTPSPRP